METDKFFCVDCEMEFATSFSLQRHGNTCHSGKNKLCKDMVSDTNTLTLHKDHNEAALELTCRENNKIFTCTVCRKQFNSKYRLEKHSTFHNVHVCDICEQVFYSSQSLRNHMKSHRKQTSSSKTEKESRGKRTYYCQICGNKFSSIFAVRRHKSFFHSSNCEADKKNIGNIISFKLHKENYKNTVSASPENYKVTHDSVCEMKSLKLSEIEKHGDIDVCKSDSSKKTREGSVLQKQHVKGQLDTLSDHSEQQSLTFSCDICKKTFYSKFNMLRHMGTHQIVHSCCICSSLFAHRTALNRHVQICCKNEKRKGLNFDLVKNGSQNIFKCKICKKMFNNFRAFTLHAVGSCLAPSSKSKIDSKGKTESDFKFVTTENKTAQDKKEIRDKYFCYNCIKAFNNLKDFKLHNLHSCPEKGKVHKAESDALHTSKLPENVNGGHKCKDCNKVFKNFRTYSLHMARRHKMKSSKPVKGIKGKDGPNLKQELKRRDTFGKHSCHICGKMLSDAKLKLHMVRSHMITPSKCIEGNCSTADSLRVKDIRSNISSNLVKWRSILKTSKDEGTNKQTNSDKTNFLDSSVAEVSTYKCHGVSRTNIFDLFSNFLSSESISSTKDTVVPFEGFRNVIMESAKESFSSLTKEASNHSGGSHENLVLNAFEPSEGSSRNISIDVSDSMNGLSQNSLRDVPNLSKELSVDLAMDVANPTGGLSNNFMNVADPSKRLTKSFIIDVVDKNLVGNVVDVSEELRNSAFLSNTSAGSCIGHSHVSGLNSYTRPRLTKAKKESIKKSKDVSNFTEELPKSSIRDVANPSKGLTESLIMNVSESTDGLPKSLITNVSNSTEGLPKSSIKDVPNPPKGLTKSLIMNISDSTEGLPKSLNRNIPDPARVLSKGLIMYVDDSSEGFCTDLISDVADPHDKLSKDLVVDTADAPEGSYKNLVGNVVDLSEELRKSVFLPNTSSCIGDSDISGMNSFTRPTSTKVKKESIRKSKDVKYCGKPKGKKSVLGSNKNTISQRNVSTEETHRKHRISCNLHEPLTTDTSVVSPNADNNLSELQTLSAKTSDNGSGFETIKFTPDHTSQHSEINKSDNESESFKHRMHLLDDHNYFAGCQSLNSDFLSCIYRFFCSFCDLRFKSKKIYKTHMRKAHSKARKYSCNLCGDPFLFKDSLKLHKFQDCQGSYKRRRRAFPRGRSTDTTSDVFLNSSNQECMKQEEKVALIDSVLCSLLLPLEKRFLLHNERQDISVNACVKSINGAPRVTSGTLDNVGKLKNRISSLCEEDASQVKKASSYVDLLLPFMVSFDKDEFDQLEVDDISMLKHKLS